jgi:phosphatidylglycerol---prolipoprotein diacylglyceryl transferase
MSMVNHPFLAWFYWNPPRDLFTIPYIDHPVRIYGICFVAGFIIGYFLLAAMYKQKILYANTIKERDIFSWDALIKYLQVAFDKPEHKIAPLVQKLDKKTRSEIMQLKCHQAPCSRLKAAILQSINDSPVKFTRAILEELFPEAIVTAKQWGYILTDKLTWFVVLGTIIGARLGDVFFYDWPYYKDNLLRIFMVWNGGLASHGGVIGVFIAVYIYYRWVLKPFPEITFIGLLDMLVVPSGLAAFFIRIGNFFNQEILGPETHMPWGIVFGNPIDGGPVVPRHPTQLYEALVYLSIFFVTLFLWNTRFTKLKPGFLCGLFFVLVFGSRFLIEFIKMPQSLLIDESFLQMGQYLSIPFVIFGLCLMAFGQKWNECIPKGVQKSEFEPPWV